jgi:hypothetical protein
VPPRAKAPEENQPHSSWFKYSHTNEARKPGYIGGPRPVVGSHVVFQSRLKPLFHVAVAALAEFCRGGSKTGIRTIGFGFARHDGLLYALTPKMQTLIPANPKQAW